jgi:HlyD family secretion protein
MAPARVHLGSMVMGKVVRVAADEGDLVKAGQTLVELSDAEQRANVVQARAALVQARARVGLVGQVTRRTADALVDESRSNHQQATRQAERARALFASGAITREQVDDAERALEVAASRLRSAEIASESARPGGGDFSVLSAGVHQAEAAFELALTRLGQTRIEAPTDSVVLRREVEPGDVVEPGRTLMVLARQGALKLAVQADEKHLAVLRLGQRATALADGLPDQPFAGEVAFLAPAVDADRGTIEVRLAVPRPPPGLRPDMTVSVNIEVGRREQALIVLEAAVYDRNTNRPWVLLVNGSRTERRDVRLGIQGDGVVEIVHGIAPSDQVVARLVSGVVPGMRARPIPSQDADAL